MISREPDLSNAQDDGREEECVFSVQEEVMPSPIDEFVIEESQSEVVIEEFKAGVQEFEVVINESEVLVEELDDKTGTESSTPRGTPEPEHEANSEPDENEDQLNGDDDPPEEQEVDDGTGSSCGTSATAIVFEDISDDETEQTETGFGGTGPTNVAIEYEDITDDENDPPKTFHYYCAKNVGVGAGATKDIFAEVQDFSKRSYKQLPISLLTPKLAPTCPKELEESFQEAQIFTIGDLSDSTAPEIEVHFRIQNPAHISKYQMTQIALADFWAQFLKAEEAQKKKADRLEKEQTETQESGCGPGPSTSTGGGWFMPLDDLSINLLRLPVDQATALLDAARSNGTKLSE